MKLVRWSPFFDDKSDSFLPTTNKSFAPSLDVYQDEKNVIVEASLPGVDLDKVEVNIENDILSISGKAEKKTEIDEENYYKKEIFRGTFHRSISLPASVKSDKSVAEFADGVLKVTVPKEGETKSKKVKIDSKKK